MRKEGGGREMAGEDGKGGKRRQKEEDEVQGCEVAVEGR